MLQVQVTLVTGLAEMDGIELNANFIHPAYNCGYSQ